MVDPLCPSLQVTGSSNHQKSARNGGLQEELDRIDELERILDSFGSSSSFDSEGEVQFEGEASAAPGIFCPFQKSFQCNTVPVGVRMPIPLGACPPDLMLPWQQVVTAEVAEKNAQELVAEEERVKRKAEKKRLKKKKQKDRKRQEKREQELRSKREAESTQPPLNGTVVMVTLENGTAGGALPAPTTGPLKPGKAMAPLPELRPPQAPSSADASTEEETEDELDLSSTFVSKARRKVGTRPATPRRERPARASNKDLEPEPEPAAPAEVPRPAPDVSAVEQSMVLAEHGNAAAARGCYEEAVCCFTEAVKLNPRDYRLFGNRSYCYEKMRQHTEALSDAQVALSLRPHWPKGCFRKGKALMGLQRYAEAEHTFEQLLRLDGSHADAAAQLEICRQLRSLGHSTGSWYSEPSSPIEALLRDMRSWSLLHGEQVDASILPDRAENTDSGFVTIVNPRNRAKGPVRLEAPTPTPTSSQLPRGWFAVWVGNVTSRITLKQLYAYFGPFGPIHSIRPIPEKFCAFVNYTQREAAEKAFAAMQGAEVEGTKLVLQLKHPVHRTPPVTHAQRPSAREPVRPPPGLERPPQQSSGRVQHPPQSQGPTRKPGPPR
ncbi:tetratricopeptide repeat protein 31 isoform X1 [Alligator mississippiensis]|uniref:tetratricopeptide repeat protein 31 isoform X1 n=1 Tax=Alligator mississippiensis TaxID=8496 RepID=UPI00071170AA|nr:tetratricopeptide repeat protein 31 isoform X1 [Alligator mississippiensis]